MFCTYFTYYSGNKLPPFYIGYCKMERIQEGYHGSVSSKQYKIIWKEELKNNPQKFKTSVLTTHDTKVEAVQKEISLQMRMNVLKNPLYINKSIGKLIDNKGRKHTVEACFAYSKAAKNRTPEHLEKIRQANLGRKVSTETRLKLSLSHIGNIPGNKGRPHSEETRRKIKQKRALQICTEETKRKMSLAQKGRIHEQYTCPYCSKSGSKPSMMIWHGEKCKQRPTV